MGPLQELLFWPNGYSDSRASSLAIRVYPIRHAAKFRMGVKVCLLATPFTYVIGSICSSGPLTNRLLPTTTVACDNGASHPADMQDSPADFTAGHAGSLP